ncbi:unnamed protein product [Pedinophyceae sp. YPF-701]|nr:unnamed protein product [Pedinophyceae sp. YPF-701]
MFRKDAAPRLTVGRPGFGRPTSTPRGSESGAVAATSPDKHRARLQPLGKRGSDVSDPDTVGDLPLMPAHSNFRGKAFSAPRHSLSPEHLVVQDDPRGENVAAGILASPATVASPAKWTQMKAVSFMKRRGAQTTDPNADRLTAAFQGMSNLFRTIGDHLRITSEEQRRMTEAFWRDLETADAEEAEQRLVELQRAVDRYDRERVAAVRIQRAWRRRLAQRQAVRAARRQELRQRVAEHEAQLTAMWDEEDRQIAARKEAQRVKRLKQGQELIMKHVDQYIEKRREALARLGKVMPGQGGADGEGLEGEDSRAESAGGGVPTVTWAQITKWRAERKAGTIGDVELVLLRQWEYKLETGSAVIEDGILYEVDEVQTASSGPQAPDEPATLSLFTIDANFFDRARSRTMDRIASRSRHDAYAASDQQPPGSPAPSTEPHKAPESSHSARKPPPKSVASFVGRIFQGHVPTRLAIGSASRGVSAMDTVTEGGDIAPQTSTASPGAGGSRVATSPAASSRRSGHIRRASEAVADDAGASGPFSEAFGVRQGGGDSRHTEPPADNTLSVARVGPVRDANGKKLRRKEEGSDADVPTGWGVSAWNESGEEHPLIVGLGGGRPPSQGVVAPSSGSGVDAPPQVFPSANDNVDADSGYLRWGAFGAAPARTGPSPRASTSPRPRHVGGESARRSPLRPLHDELGWASPRLTTAPAGANRPIQMQGMRAGTENHSASVHDAALDRDRPRSRQHLGSLPSTAPAVDGTSLLTGALRRGEKPGGAHVDSDGQHVTVWAAAEALQGEASLSSLHVGAPPPPRERKALMPGNRSLLQAAQRPRSPSRGGPALGSPPTTPRGPLELACVASAPQASGQRAQNPLVAVANGSAAASGSPSRRAASPEPCLDYSLSLQVQHLGGAAIGRMLGKLPTPDRSKEHVVRMEMRTPENKAREHMQQEAQAFFADGMSGRSLTPEGVSLDKFMRPSESPQRRGPGLGLIARGQHVRVNRRTMPEVLGEGTAVVDEGLPEIRASHRRAPEDEATASATAVTPHGMTHRAATRYKQETPPCLQRTIHSALKIGWQGGGSNPLPQVHQLGFGMAEVERDTSPEHTRPACQGIVGRLSPDPSTRRVGRLSLSATQAGLRPRPQRTSPPRFAVAPR